MFNPHTKFEVSTITCNEEMKGNTKCKNSRFEPAFGDLGVTHRVHLWLDGKRIVDFLLATIEHFSSSHDCGTIKQNLSKSALSEGMGHLRRCGRRPQSVYGPLDTEMMQLQLCR